jgi:peptidoglycan/LPS O-acetylase OafA/YrhL
MQHRTTVQVLQRSIMVIRSVVIIAFLAVLGLFATSQGIGSLGMSAGGHTVIAVLSLALILLASISEGGRTQTLFRQPWLVWPGTVSYGIYLFHQPLSGFFHGSLRGQVPQIGDAADAAVTLLALSCTLLLAGLSWRFFERPIVMAGQRVSYQWQHRVSCIESTPRQAMS